MRNDLTGRVRHDRRGLEVAIHARLRQVVEQRPARQAQAAADHADRFAAVPADRHRFGLVLSFPIADNLVLTSYYRPPYARGMLRNDEAIEHDAVESIRNFDIRTPSADRRAGTLSGGNQQKVVVAREFDRELRLLILDQPTRGLDVGSIESIHKLIIEKRNAGTAVLLVSAELDEVLEMSDRIGVMFRGKIVDVSADHVMIEISGQERKIEAFIELMRPFGILELARTGRIALVRGRRGRGDVL